MKKIITTTLLFISIHGFSADMPKHLQGTWFFRLYTVGEHPWVYRTPTKFLLYSKGDTVDVLAERLKIKSVKVTENNYIRSWTEVHFVGRPDLVLDIRYMKEADFLSAIFYKNGKISMMYHFFVYKGVLN